MSAQPEPHAPGEIELRVLDELQLGCYKGKKFYEQVAKVLDSSRDNPTLLCATLRLLEQALSAHAHESASTILPELMSARGLLYALATLLPPAPTPGPSPLQVLLADGIGAVMNAAWAPVLNQGFVHGLRVLTPGWLVCPTDPSSRVFLFGSDSSSNGTPSLARQLLWYGLPILQGPDAAAYRQAAAAVAALCRALPPRGPHIPGAEALLAAGSLTAMQTETELVPAQYLPAGLTGQDVLASFTKSPLVPADSSTKFIRKLMFVLEQDEQCFSLPNAGFSFLLATAVKTSQGQLCELLVHRQQALAMLARPLQALADDFALWRAGHYLEHIRAIEDLCSQPVQDVNEQCRQPYTVEGVRTLEALARHLARPAVKALSALLELDPAKDKLAEPLLVALLGTLGCVGVTATGSNAIRRQAGDLAHWLSSAVCWRAASNAVAVRMLWFLQIITATVGCLRMHQPELGLVDVDVKQVATSGFYEALMTLMHQLEDRPDSQDHIAGILFWLAVSNVPASGSVVDALLEAARPKMLAAACWKATAENKKKVRQQQQQQPLTQLDTTKHLRALDLVIRFQQQGQDDSHVDRASMQAVASVALGWLDTFAADEPMVHVSAYTHDLLMTSIKRLGAAGAFSVPDLLSRGILERLVALTPRFTTDNEWRQAMCAVTVLCNYGITHGDSRLENTGAEGSVTGQLAHALARPAVLDRLLQQAAREWQLLAGAGNKQAAATAGNAAMAADDDGRWFLKQTTNILARMATTRLWQVQHQGTSLKLLQADAIWEMSRASQDADDVRPCCRILFRQLIQHGGTRNAELASMRLLAMGEQVVARQLRELPAQYQAEVRQRLAGSSMWAGSSVLPVAAGQRTSLATPDLGLRGACHSKGLVAKGNGSSSCSSAASSASFSSTKLAGKGSAATRSGQGATGNGSSSSKSTTASSASTGGTKLAARSGTTDASPLMGDLAKHAATLCVSQPAAAAAAAHAAASTSAGAASKSDGGRECSVCHVQPEQILLCGRCKSIRYCSTQCQRADWKTHKVVCKQLQAGHRADAAST